VTSGRRQLLSEDQTLASDGPSQLSVVPAIALDFSRVLAVPLFVTPRREKVKKAGLASEVQGSVALWRGCTEISHCFRLRRGAHMSLGEETCTVEMSPGLDDLMGVVSHVFVAQLFFFFSFLSCCPPSQFGRQVASFAPCC